jgi:aminopeptidase N
MFNQPDLKARFTLGIGFPEDWRVVSNSLIKEGGGSISEPDFGHPEKSVTTSWMRFDDTKPISTYVLAFAAGPWQQMSTTIGNEDTTH